MAFAALAAGGHLPPFHQRYFGRAQPVEGVHELVELRIAGGQVLAALGLLLLVLGVVRQPLALFGQREGAAQGFLQGRAPRLPLRPQGQLAGERHRQP